MTGPIKNESYDSVQYSVDKGAEKTLQKQKSSVANVKGREIQLEQHQVVEESKVSELLSTASNTETQHKIAVRHEAHLEEGVFATVQKPLPALLATALPEEEDTSVLRLDLLSLNGASEDASDLVPVEFMPTPDELVQNASPDDTVILWRGTHRQQAENILKNNTASGVDKREATDTPEMKPGKNKKSSRFAKKKAVHDQIGKGRKLPEYTASKDIGNGFSRDHYLVIIEVKRGLLTRGSRFESGWILMPNADVKPLAVVDCTLGKDEKFTPNAS